MSEFWVSKKRYYCKYCEIYIADDQPSRQQHENGLRHKGNRDRFIRGLYKQGEKKKKDQDEEKREIDRIEKLAQAAYAQDVGAGRGGRSQPTASTSTASAPAKKPAPTKPSDPYANYSSAASLGFTDPDVERLNAEQERKNTQGVAGEWQVVESEPPPDPIPDSETAVPQKRRAEEAPVVDSEDTRFFKLQKRTLATGLGQIYDPGVITLKPKTKPTTKTEEVETKVEDSTTLTVASTPTAGSTEEPKWTSRSWQEAPEDSAGVLPDDLGVPPDHAQQEVETAPEVKREEEEIKQEEVEVKQEVEPPASSSGGLFKKRKIPNAGKRGVRT